MRLSSMGPVTIIKWGQRLLYVMLFLSLLIVFGNFDKPYTITFLGSVFALIVPVLFLLKEEEQQGEFK